MTFDEPNLGQTDPETESGSDCLDSFGEGRKIKNTSSICPECLAPVDAQVFERHGEVWMDKSCVAHGRFSALLAADAKHYFLPTAQSLKSASCCGSSCGPLSPVVLPGTVPGVASEANSNQWTNHSCTILIEIIERCNLSCPTCFAGSSPQQVGLMSLDEFSRQVEQLVVGGKCGSDMIQLSGGEPTIHPQFFEMVELLFKRGFKQVCINSNGLKLAQPAFTEKLAECMQAHHGDQLFVYLQFDGFEDATHAALRGRQDLLKIKRRALANCQAHNINIHPVMTLTRGINEHEVGAFVQLAVDNPALKNIVIQPAMYSGRYANPRRQDRITLADTVGLICTQFGVFSPEDFTPIPCSDPNCFGMAVAFRSTKGLIPVSRYFPRHASWGKENVRGLIDTFSDTINGPQAISEAIRWATSEGQIGSLLEDLDDAEVDGLLEVLAAAQADGSDLWDKLLTISIKPFMDAWTYDQDRVDQCCVHILDEDGNPVSFCEFNAINRPRRMKKLAVKLSNMEISA